MKPIAISATVAVKPGEACGDQNALRARRRNVDVADVDGHVQEGDEIGCVGKEFGRARSLSVGDNNVAAARRLRQGACIEHHSGPVEAHLAKRAQCGERTFAIIIRQHVGCVGGEDGRYGVRL